MFYQESVGYAVSIQDDLVDPLTAEVQYEKVHIRGVDELTTDDIKQFAFGHFKTEEPSRIEWIDDTSANIVYTSEDMGVQALMAFTQLGEDDATSQPLLRLRTAKSLPTHPESVLQVRSSVRTDRKKPRAHEASRFYLMHPEHDPREKLRRELAERRRQGRRDDNSDGDYTRRLFDEREHRRRRDRGGEEGFSANMYDDVPEMSRSGSRRRESSMEFSDAEGPTHSRRGRRAELFPDRVGNQSKTRRNRSASPGNKDREEDRRSESDPLHSRKRFRERSPQLSRTNEGKELFPSRMQPESGDPSMRELFPNKTAANYLKKELFPNKSSVSNHRRSDAFDAANETADLFSKRISVPLIDGIQNGSTLLEEHNGIPSGSGGQAGINIRGAAPKDQGISIRGTANGVSIKGTASVKELFPSRYKSNAGKELFSDKLEGRGGRRRKAEDMFY
jgi:Nuclear cap-binding protein subunit 3